MFNANDYSSWKDILEITLRRQHLYDLDLGAQIDIILSLNTGPGAKHAAWNTLLQNGFWLALMRAIGRSDFCGYSRDELASPKDTYIQLRMRVSRSMLFQVANMTHYDSPAIYYLVSTAV